MAEILEILRGIASKLNEKTKASNKATFSIDEAAGYVGISHNKIRELTARADTDFPFFKSGRNVLIDKRLLDAWLEKISREHREI